MTENCDSSVLFQFVDDHFFNLLGGDGSTFTIDSAFRHDDDVQSLAGNTFLRSKADTSYIQVQKLKSTKKKNSKQLAYSQKKFASVIEKWGTRRRNLPYVYTHTRKIQHLNVIFCHSRGAKVLGAVGRLNFREIKNSRARGSAFRLYKYSCDRIINVSNAFEENGNFRTWSSFLHNFSGQSCGGGISGMKT